jgi:hypothetical protein
MSYSAFYKRLSAYLKWSLRQNSSDSEQAPPWGLKILEWEHRDSVKETDPEAVEVLGICRSAIPGKPAFVDVLGIVEKGRLIAIPDEELRDLYYEDGAIIVHENAVAGRMPRQGELDIWSVENYTTSQPIKFRACRPPTHVYTVVDFHLLSGDYDAVRAFLKNYLMDPATRAIFKLADGLLIKPKFDQQDLSQEAFEEPLPAWYALCAYEWNSRLIVLGPLPEPDVHYDCAELASTIRKVLRTPEGLSRLPSFSRAQLREFIEYLKSSDLELASPRIARIERELDKYVSALVD